VRHFALDIRKNFLSSNALTRFFTGGCNYKIIDQVVCKNLLYEMCGPSTSINLTRIGVYLRHFPAGTSVKNMVHFAQILISGQSIGRLYI
jgi:lysosomal acid lipase/cholesteryl ester hydrolase